MSKSSDLSKIRDKIDSLDNQILSLLNDRAELAIQAGKAKEESIKYKPARETSILKRVMDLNEGPLESEQVKNVFNEIINKIKPVTQLKVKEHAGLSNKAVFKFMDIIDIKL